MNKQEIVEIAFTILASLGGGALIIAAFAHWLGDVWAKRLIQNEKKKLDAELEGYKIKLKKSEFLFQKEYEAASAFVAYSRKLLPTYSYPDMEWNEACDEMALELGRIELWIQNFIATHGAILSREVIEKLSICRGLAGRNKFEAGGIDEPVSEDANKAAEKIHQEFESIEEILIKTVRQQSENGN
jgi:hypothetical protein